MIQHPAEHLTSNYRKDEESNNYKLLSLGHEEHIEILNNLNKVEASRDIEEAAGFTLDKAGKNVLELRGSRNDEAFRRAIKIKIRSNLSAGTVEDINAIADILFGENFESVSETWDKEQYDCEPAALLLSIADDPDEQMLFIHYIKYLLMEIKAGGVRLYSRILSQIPQSTIYTGAAVASDNGSMLVKTRMLTNMTFTHSICAKTAIINDFSQTRIPVKMLEDKIIYGCIYSGVAVSNVSYMRIPTAKLREVVEN